MSRFTPLLVATIAFLAVAGCSPEADRARSGGQGGDIGNTAPPVEMHGDQARNNPNFGTPSIGRAPSDAKGVPGWWARRGQ
jgi:hypothetical protein